MIGSHCPQRAARLRRRWVLHAGAISAALLVAAGGCGWTSEPSEDATTGSAAVQVQQTGSCGGLDLAAAGELLGCKDVRIAAAIEEGTAVHCVMSCAGDEGQALGYSVESSPDADVASAVLEGMRRAVARTGPVQELSGVGEDAWSAAGPVRRLGARAGTTIVEVIQPPDPDTQRRAAAAILAAQ